jgi:hypothetical protein
MLKRRAYRLSITSITFLLGTAFQFLLAQWLPSKEVLPLSLMVIIVSLVLILTISSDSLNSLEKVIDLASRSGIRVEYIEDDYSGKTYRRQIELIKNTNKRIIIVSPWEPFAEYQANEAFVNIRSARHNYYEEINRQIDLHRHSELFHERIIQVPREYEGKSLPFKIDFIFFDYLKHAAEMQRTNPRSCRLRRAPLQIHIHFTIIDERYVIMPIFTSLKNERLIRHGVLIFDDRQGDLVRGLKGIYETLNAQSKPIEVEQLEVSDEK